jgi:UDP-glucose-4-epimerase GalE
MLQDLSANGELKFVSLRYFNAAGADPDGDTGEMHDPETHLIPLVLQTAAGTRAYVDIYGKDYDTPDGTCIRDYIHVTDLADAHIKALDYLMNGGGSRAYNLGTETGYSVNEIIQNAIRITGRHINTQDAPRRPGDPPALVADSSRIKQDLNWCPGYSDLDSILLTSWNWLQQITD